MPISTTHSSAKRRRPSVAHNIDLPRHRYCHVIEAAVHRKGREVIDQKLGPIGPLHYTGD